MALDFFVLAEKAGKQLKQLGLKLVTAESCTGGGLGYWITAVPGSSDWFDRGFITYQDEAKQEMLDISSASLQQYGAVSEQVVIEMAQQAIQKSHAQVSIAITGIAGPTGGSPEKPVGLVWLAWITPHKEFSTSKYFTGSRSEIREQAIALALNNLIDLLK